VAAAFDVAPLFFGSLVLLVSNGAKGNHLATKEQTPRWHLIGSAGRKPTKGFYIGPHTHLMKLNAK